MSIWICFPWLYDRIWSKLTCHFSLNQTNSFYEKFLFSIFFGLYITTTFPCNLHKMIDPIDPCSHPQGVPQLQAQYIKLNTPCTIPILIIFTYMVANEVSKNIFWVEDVQRPIRPKNWPKKGQNFPKMGNFWFFSLDYWDSWISDYFSLLTFSSILLFEFLAFFGPKGQKFKNKFQEKCQ